MYDINYAQSAKVDRPMDEWTTCGAEVDTFDDTRIVFVTEGTVGVGEKAIFLMPKFVMVFRTVRANRLNS